MAVSYKGSNRLQKSKQFIERFGFKKKRLVELIS